MPYVAALPAIGLLTGAAAALLLPSSFSLLPFVPAIAFAILICGGALAVWCWHAAHPRLLATLVVTGFFAGGTLLAVDAWRRAWSPPLSATFEQRARMQRARAEAEGRRLPEDGEAAATVEGVLRADAARSESGVSLSIDVDWVEREAGREGQERQEGQGSHGRHGGRAKALAER